MDLRSRVEGIPEQILPGILTNSLVVVADTSMDNIRDSEMLQDLGLAKVVEQVVQLVVPNRHFGLLVLGIVADSAEGMLGIRRTSILLGQPLLKALIRHQLPLGSLGERTRDGRIPTKIWNGTVIEILYHQNILRSQLDQFLNPLLDMLDDGDGGSGGVKEIVVTLEIDNEKGRGEGLFGDGFGGIIFVDLLDKPGDGEVGCGA